MSRSIESQDDATLGQAVLWVMQYCPWDFPEGSEGALLSRPFAGSISKTAFAFLHYALVLAYQNSTLPTVNITPTTFKDFIGGKVAHKAAIEELTRLGLIEIDAPRNGVSVWTLCVGAEARP